MCTVSWRRDATGYELFFNRDEAHTRRPALPPQIHLANGVRWLAATDADKGGTWLGVNEYGVTVGVLNRYADPCSRTRSYASRGWLVRDALVYATAQSVADYWQSLDLTQFPPCTLFILTHSETRLAAWKGRVLRWADDADALMPLSSSSFLTAEVIAHRRQLFAVQAAQQDLTTDFLRAFHRSHDPAPGPYSVCLHRHDAQTVSLTQISVKASEISLSYQAGPPCQAIKRLECHIAAKRPVH